MTTKTGRPSIPYHKQLEDNYCGPACAQMILDYLGVNELDQARIVAQLVNSPNTSMIGESLYDSWFTTPDELVTMLQSLAPEPDRTFAAQRSSDHSQFQTRLKKFVEDQSIPPPIVPVHGLAGHWVVFFQYHVCGRKKSYFGYDPFFNPEDRDAVPNEPAVINIADQKKNFGITRNLVAIVKSPDVSARGFTPEGGQDAPADESEVIKTVGDDENFPMEQKGVSLDPLPSSASGQFPPQLIAKQAMDELTAYGLMNPGNTKSVTSPGAPLLVKVPDAPDENYYLIGLQQSSNKNRILTRLDASDGQYLDSLSIPPTEYILGKSAIGSKMYEKVHEQLVTKMKKESWFRAFEAQLNRTNPDGFEEPNLMWKFCNESQSHFYPFYEVHDGQTTFYVRIDGKVFTNLTTSRRERNPAIRK